MEAVQFFLYQLDIKINGDQSICIPTNCLNSLFIWTILKFQSNFEVELQLLIKLTSCFCGAMLASH